ncbi:hypothetical protein AB1N83_004654 [Pleurotus pulmonarius]
MMGEPLISDPEKILFAYKLKFGMFPELHHWLEINAGGFCLSWKQRLSDEWSGVGLLETASIDYALTPS